MAASETTSSTNVDGVADELYGLPLDQFTGTRNDRAKALKRDGDSVAASAVSKLAKPNTVAWLANQLVRQHADEIDPLLDLGRAMREATSSLDAAQLRQLSKQQHQVVYALVRQARRLADAVGQRVSDETARSLEDTLHAALADETVAARLKAGRLTTALSRSGFPGMAPDDTLDRTPDGNAASAAPGESRTPATKAGPSKKPPSKQPTGRGAAASEAAQRKRRIAQAREDERAAEAAARDAERAKLAAQQVLATAQRAVADADAALERLQAELADASRARTDAERSRRQARKVADRAVQAAQRASRQHTQASQRLRELT